MGVAPIKTLAKIANRLAKKHTDTGVYVIDNEAVQEQALTLTRVEDVWGIGRQYTRLLQQHRIHTALDLALADISWIKKHMSIVGERMVRELCGQPCYRLDDQPQPKRASAPAGASGTPSPNIRLWKKRWLPLRPVAPKSSGNSTRLPT